MTSTATPESSRAAGRRTSRRGTRAILLGALLAGVAFIAVVSMAVSLVLARGEMLRAASRLQGTTALAAPSLLRAPRSRQKLRARLVAAEGELRAAHQRLAPWDPILTRLGWVPTVGGELSATPALSGASLDATRAALHLLDGLAPAASVLERTGQGSPSLRTLAPALVRGGKQFALAERAAGQAQRELPAASHSGNVMLDTAVRQLRAGVPLLAVTAHWLAASPALLGAGSPSRELILIQDPRELRATGGFIGASGIATLHHGAITYRFGSSVLPHEISSVPPPTPEMLYTPESAWLFRDSNWSPDFPLSARLARWFYGEDTGVWADGVVGIQTSLAPPLLAITGPVYLPAYHRWVTADTVAGVANQYINGQYHGPSAQGGGDTIRKQFVGDVFAAVLGRLATLPASRWPDLAALLARAATQRTILLYDRRPAVEAAIRASHAGGAFGPAVGDTLAIVDDNRSYNKINPYVEERAAYTVLIQPNLTMAATLRIRYHVLPSPANLEGCGPFCGLDGTVHDYQDFLRVFVPNGANIGRVSGLDLWKPRPAYGMMQVAGRLLVRAGQTRTVTIHYRLPANILGGTGFRSYRLTIWHQPGTARRVSVRVEGLGGVQVNGHLSSESHFRLTSDQHLDLSISGAGAPGPVVLPPKVWKDPYIPWGVLTASKRPL